MAKTPSRPGRSSRTAPRSRPSYRIVKGYSYDLYRTIKVPGYRYKRGRRWIRVSGYTYQQFVRTVVVPARRVYLEPEIIPEQVKPEPAPRRVSAVPQPGEWIPVPDFMAAVEFWAAQESGPEGPGLVEIDFEIGKKSIISDWISRDKFVWPSARYPRGVTLKGFSRLGDEIFDRARVWVAISHKETHEFRLWVRTVTLKDTMNFDQAKAEVVGPILGKIAEEFANKTYLIFHGLVAWTLYSVARGDKAMKRRSKGYREGSA